MATTAILALFLAALPAGDENPNRRAQYRGPFEELLVAFPSPSPIPPVFPQDPLIGGGDALGQIEAYFRWDFWFEANKDLLIRSRDLRRRELLPATTPNGPAAGDDGRVRANDARGPIAKALRAALKSSDDRVVRYAALGLGRIGDKNSIEDLEALTTTGILENRRYAAMALGMIEDRAVLSKLFNLVLDSQTPTQVRVGAVLGIGFHGRREGARFLRDFLDKAFTNEAALGADADVLVATVTAIGLCRDRDAAPLLIARFRGLKELRSGRTHALETAVLQALGRIGDPSAQLVLLEALQPEEKNEQLRRAAALALGDLGDRGALKPLVTALHDDNDEQVRGFAAISLGRMGGEVAREALREAFAAKTSRTLKTFTALALGLLGDRASAPKLLEALAQPSEDLQRASFAIALGLLEEPKAVEPLLKLVESRGTNLRLRGYAAIALGMIRAEGTLERLVKLLEDDADKVDLWRRSLLLGIGLYGDARVGAAITRVLAADARELVREHAALALNLCRPRGEIEALAKLLEKESYRGELALYAVAALSGLGDRYEAPLVSETFFNANYRQRNTLLEELMYVL